MKPEEIANELGKFILTKIEKTTYNDIIESVVNQNISIKRTKLPRKLKKKQKKEGKINLTVNVSMPSVTSFITTNIGFINDLSKL